VASRKEQKEALRREREQREQEAREAERRKRLVGYGAGAALALAAVVVLAVLLLSGGGGDASADVLPDGGEVPGQRIGELEPAAEAAGCELKSRRVKRSEVQPDGSFHVIDINQKPSDPLNPPTAGTHYPEPAGDGAYGEPPPTMQVVHALEHGRVVVWFKRNLPNDVRANLKAFFDEDDYQMLLTPNTTNMPYAVAASAWNREPEPLGTGRLLGCPTYNDKVFDALRSFRDEHRSNGPEPVP
jgi:hypothetical protein